jgi:nucleoside-diphosphate-sugar epimerase
LAGANIVSRFTVFGAAGFVGARLARRLEAAGHAVLRITRANWPAPGADLGHVIFTIGMTADFREKPFETVDAQVQKLYAALHDYTYESFLYLSSTRVYRQQADTSEGAALALNPNDPDDLYNASKIVGESLCLALKNPAIRVARLSNLFGAPAPSQSFLASVLAEARRTGHVTFRSAPEAEKDYLDVESAVSALIAIALSGRERLYNVASGRNISNAMLAERLASLGIACHFEPHAPAMRFSPLSIARLAGEFGHVPPSVLDALPALLAASPEE